MKRLLDNISDMLADAALLEMGVDVQAAGVSGSRAASETAMSRLSRVFQDLTDTWADAAVLEMGLTEVMLREDRARRDIAHPTNASTATTISASCRKRYNSSVFKYTM